MCLHVCACVSWWGRPEEVQVCAQGPAQVCQGAQPAGRSTAEPPWLPGARTAGAGPTPQACVGWQSFARRLPFLRGLRGWPLGAGPHTCTLRCSSTDLPTEPGPIRPSASDTSLIVFLTTVPAILAAAGPAGPLARVGAAIKRAALSTQAGDGKQQLGCRWGQSRRRIDSLSCCPVAAGAGWC